MVSTILTAMLTVMIPRLAMLMGHRRMDDYNKLLKNVINTVLAIVIPGCIGLFMVSRDVVLIISSEKYLRATASWQIFSFAIIGSALSTIFNQCVLMPAKRERKSLISFSVSAIVVFYSSVGRSRYCMDDFVVSVTSYGNELLL